MAPEGTTARPEARFRTRHFEAGRPDRRKHIDAVTLTGPAGVAGEMRPLYITDRGVTRDTYAAQGMPIRLTPHARRVTAFALAAEGERLPPVEGLTVAYRLLER